MHACHPWPSGVRKRTPPSRMQNLPKAFINLDLFDQLVFQGASTTQERHNVVISFHSAFDVNDSRMKNVGKIEIAGCDVPIYMALSAKFVSFICRSKVLRAYIFCLVINYAFNSLSFDFEEWLEKYKVRRFLSDGRITALKNVYELIKKLPTYALRECTIMNGYTFDVKLQLEARLQADEGQAS